jgi:hypothetical protein
MISRLSVAGDGQRWAASLSRVDNRLKVTRQYSRRFKQRMDVSLHDIPLLIWVKLFRVNDNASSDPIY